MNKKIAIDIDDTISDSLGAVHKLANSKIDFEIPFEDFMKPGEYWGYYDRVWVEHGLKDRIISQQIFEELQKNQALFPLLPSAEFAVHELMKSYDIVLITSRDEECREYTEAWLRDQFGDNAPDLYFCSNHKNSDSKTKGQICQYLKAGWLIDDNVEHCLGARSEGVTPILFGEYGWHHNKPEEIINCKTWQEVLEYFEGIEANG